MPRPGTRGVRPGDKVVVESSTRAILAVTWLVYMLPVVFSLLGYFLSAGIDGGWRYAVAIAAAAVSLSPSSCMTAMPGSGTP